MKTQWPLVVLERPARWETAEAAHQRPHQIDSSLHAPRATGSHRPTADGGGC